MLCRSLSWASENHQLLGKPKSGELSHQEIELFQAAGISLSSEKVFFYPKLRTRDSNRIIYAQNYSKFTKRNNSCVIFLDNSYGIIEKIIHHSSMSSFFVLIKMLVPADINLCNDPVTNVKIKHIEVLTFQANNYNISLIN